MPQTMNTVIAMVLLEILLKAAIKCTKRKMLNEKADSNEGSSDTFNSMISEGPISNENLDDFIKTFSEMTAFIYIRIPCVLQEIHQNVQTWMKRM